MHTYHQVDELARARHAEMHRLAASRRPAAPVKRQHRSLRVRTGWTLVGLGLKLAVPAQRRPVPASSVRS